MLFSNFNLWFLSCVAVNMKFAFVGSWIYSQFSEAESLILDATSLHAVIKLIGLLI